MSIVVHPSSLAAVMPFTLRWTSKLSLSSKSSRSALSTFHVSSTTPLGCIFAVILFGKCIIFDVMVFDVMVTSLFSLSFKLALM